jgi:hypothetical protein
MKCVIRVRLRVKVALCLLQQVIHIKILTLRNIGIPDVATVMGITKSAIAASLVGEYFQILCGSLHLCILEADRERESKFVAGIS